MSPTSRAMWFNPTPRGLAGSVIRCSIHLYDTFGGGYVDLALELGVAPDRIDTIIDFAAAAKHGVKTDGNSAANAKVLSELASLVDTGRLEIPIAKVYHLANVREAYQDLARRHTHGKIVLVP
jgi:NADPH:quinone reductase-like Zn-dependent oxidoreductase